MLRKAEFEKIYKIAGTIPSRINKEDLNEFDTSAKVTLSTLTSQEFEKLLLIIINTSNWQLLPFLYEYRENFAKEVNEFKRNLLDSYIGKTVTHFNNDAKTAILLLTFGVTWKKPKITLTSTAADSGYVNEYLKEERDYASGVAGYDVYETSDSAIARNRQNIEYYLVDFRSDPTIITDFFVTIFKNACIFDLSNVVKALCEFRYMTKAHIELRALSEEEAKIVSIKTDLDSLPAISLLIRALQQNIDVTPSAAAIAAATPTAPVVAVPAPAAAVPVPAVAVPAPAVAVPAPAVAIPAPAVAVPMELANDEVGSESEEEFSEESDEEEDQQENMDVHTVPISQPEYTAEELAVQSEAGRRYESIRQGFRNLSNPIYLAELKSRVAQHAPISERDNSGMRTESLQRYYMENGIEMEGFHSVVSRHEVELQRFDLSLPMHLRQQALEKQDEQKCCIEQGWLRVNTYYDEYGRTLVNLAIESISPNVVDMLIKLGSNPLRPSKPADSEQEDATPELPYEHAFQVFKYRTLTPGQKSGIMHILNILHSVTPSELIEAIAKKDLMKTAPISESESPMTVPTGGLSPERQRVIDKYKANLFVKLRSEDRKEGFFKKEDFFKTLHGFIKRYLVEIKSAPAVNKIWAEQLKNATFSLIAEKNVTTNGRYSIYKTRLENIWDDYIVKYEAN